MGIVWMTKDEINEAIPPAYTEFIGPYLLQQVAVQQSFAADVLSPREAQPKSDNAHG